MKYSPENITIDDIVKAARSLQAEAQELHIETAKLTGDMIPSFGVAGDSLHSFQSALVMLENAKEHRDSWLAKRDTARSAAVQDEYAAKAADFLNELGFEKTSSLLGSKKPSMPKPSAPIKRD